MKMDHQHQQLNTVCLDGTWRIQHYDSGEMNPLEVSAPGLDDRYWVTAAVPGDIHSTLIQHQLIPDPYYGHQDQLSRWVEQKEWWYRTTFDYVLTDNERERHVLTFAGLDTFAVVYVNGHEIGQTANMHRTYTFDITRVLRSGWNSIAVRFDPLHLHHQDKEKFDWSSYTKERPWLRKAAMNFGWDWGPRLVTVGIWGSVHIRRHRTAALKHVYAYTEEIHDEQAVLGITIDYQYVRPIRYTGFNTYRNKMKQSVQPNEQAYVLFAPSALVPESDSEGDLPSQSESLNLTIVLNDRDGQEVVRQQRQLSALASAVYKSGALIEQIHLTMEIAQPHLWWTHDLGDPYLYQLIVSLSAGEQELDHYEQQIGLRTIKLQLHDEQEQPQFAFILNGIRLYAKGANWIPADNRIGAIPEDRYYDLLELSAEAHMNMMRVWAGGIYEKDIFYECCDRLGILVWQDFTFANALFPDFNHDFMENVRAEIEDNVRRLRSYTSLALWCGNNEIDWLYDMKTASGDITSPFYGEVIYHELIPDLLEELDPHRSYWPSSPYGGNDANDPDSGDRHNWQVWHGSVYPRSYGEPPLLDYSVQGVSFHHYKEDKALFSSEFGMHAAANTYTLSSYIPNQQFYWNSPEVAYRNKDTNHRKGILLMEGYTGVPQDMEQYIRYSMLTQAEGLKYGIEHYRRHKNRNSGSLIWQLNDSWPGTSWSMIDYHLLPKAAYFYARTFYHPLLLCADHDPEGMFNVWMVNDTLNELNLPVTVKVITLQGQEVNSYLVQVKVSPNTAAAIINLTEDQLLTSSPAYFSNEQNQSSATNKEIKLQPHEVVVILSADHRDLQRNLYYLRPPLELELPAANWELEIDQEMQMITITNSHTLARMVRLNLDQGNLRFSDNYFDLLPGEIKVVHIRHSRDEEVLWDTLQIDALNNPAD